MHSPLCGHTAAKIMPGPVAFFAQVDDPVSTRSIELKAAIKKRMTAPSTVAVVKVRALRRMFVGHTANKGYHN